MNDTRHDGTKEMKEAGRDVVDAVEKTAHTAKEEVKDAGRDVRDAAEGI